MTVTKHILVLHTGGTISMTENSEGDIMPSHITRYLVLTVLSLLTSNSPLKKFSTSHPRT